MSRLFLAATNELGGSLKSWKELFFLNGDSRWKGENAQENSGAGGPYTFEERPPDKFSDEAAPLPTGTAPGDGPADGPAEEKDYQGFLELVYGILFEPAKTMTRVTRRPPLAAALLVVTILSVLGSLMGLLTASRVLDQSLQEMAMGQFFPVMRALAPLGVVLGLFWGYVKWFGYSAVLHLAADLLGGRGSARGVFAAAGLAGLPGIFMIPAQFMAYWFGGGKLAVAVLVGLIGLAVGIWSIVILVIGVKQVYGLSTGRIVLIVFSPYLALAAMGIIIILALVAAASSMPVRQHLPGYF